MSINKFGNIVSFLFFLCCEVIKLFSNLDVLYLDALYMLCSTVLDCVHTCVLCICIYMSALPTGVPCSIAEVFIVSAAQ